METLATPKAFNTSEGLQSGRKTKAEWNRQVLLPSWTSHYRPVSIVPNQHLEALPPVVGDIGAGSLTIDFTPLILFDRIIVDSGTLWRVRSERQKREYRLLAECLEILIGEGRVQLYDYSAIARQLESEIKAGLDLDLMTPPYWINPMADAIDGWWTRASEMRNVFGSRFELRDKIPHGPNFALFKEGGRLTENRAKQLCAKLRPYQRKNCLYKPDSDIEQMLIAYLSYINTNLLLADYFSCPVYDWPNFDQFYRLKFQLGGTPEPLSLRERGLVKRLFQITLPNCQPTNVQDFLKMVNDKHLKNFRLRISEWASEEKREKLTIDLKTEMAAAMAAQNRAQSIPHKKLMLWGIIGTKALSLIPGMHKISLGIETALELRNKATAHEIMRPHQWYFFTQCLLNK